MTFSTSYDNFGYEQVVEFLDCGQTIAVTDENKQEFVRLYADWFLNTSIEAQFRPFYKGFYKVISNESINVRLCFTQLLDSGEVIKLICGIDEIDLVELEQSTTYENCDAKDQTVVWFWDVVKSFTEEEKKNLLKFTTGSDRTPLRGLTELNFVIMVQGLDDSRLPSAHTCFNHLILPQYSTKEILRQKLLQAIQNHEGFGLM